MPFLPIKGSEKRGNIEPNAIDTLCQATAIIHTNRNVINVCLFICFLPYLFPWWWFDLVLCLLSAVVCCWRMVLLIFGKLKRRRPQQSHTESQNTSTNTTNSKRTTSFHTLWRFSRCRVYIFQFSIPNCRCVCVCVYVLIVFTGMILCQHSAIFSFVCTFFSFFRCFSFVFFLFKFFLSFYLLLFCVFAAPCQRKRYFV